MSDLERLVDLEKMYEEVQILPNWYALAHDNALAIRNNLNSYQVVSDKTHVPAIIIGVIHMMESHFNFGTHLHNGDPLTARTVHVPAGRPESGHPPFLWEESAVDALSSGRFSNLTLGGILNALEGYNGYGYRKHGVNSPYLWSGTQFYTSGKYVSDGVFNTTAVSKQIGCVPVLKILEELNFKLISSKEKESAYVS